MNALLQQHGPIMQPLAQTMTATAQPVQTAQPVAQTPLPGGMPPLPGHLGKGPRNPHGGGVGTPTPTPTTAPATNTPTTALNNFANSAGMQFAEQQQANMLNNYYAGHGALLSGAAGKAFQDRGSQIALQNYFFPYMSYLGQQQAMGAGAASSIAGVGSNFGNTVANLGQNYANAAGNINSNMGNAIANGALNVGNANANNAAIGGLANANMYNTIGSQIGNVASSFIHPY
jgi:hypothetical protein